MPSGRYGGATGSLPANNRNTSTAYASLSATGSAAGTMSAPRGASPPPSYPSAYPSAASGSTLSGSLGPFSLPSVPVYPSSMTGSRPLPPLRPLEALARRGRPRWGLRFFMLLIVAGVAAYFLRPYIPWIDSRIRPVEEAVRGFAQQTGLDHHLARLFGKVAPSSAPAITAPPAPPPAPVAVERAPAPAVKPAAAAAKSAVPGARPDIEPLSPRASRGAGAAPAAPGRPAAAAASRRAAAKSALAARRAQREVASPRLRGLAARQRSAAVRRRMAFAASARRLREEPMPADDEITSAAPSAGVAAAVARPAPAPAAAAPEEAPAPAAKPAPEPAPAVEKGPAPRTTATLVKEAASSGDELDRLMAGAVSEKPAAPARRGGDRAIAEIDRKLAAVDKGGAAPGGGTGRLKPAAATSAPPLSTGDIKTVMAGVQKQMNACYRQHGKMGQADVKVDVAPDGSVAGTLIRGELAGTPTGACVESKIKAASFPASSGLRFDYRLSVR